jgi:predicted GH43/DUF377 family glycosyl hydrolase
VAGPDRQGRRDLAAGMTWRKLGQIFVPDGRKAWMQQHAANPTPQWMDGNRYRIYFSSRDARNRSSISFVELDLADPRTILSEADQPVLSPGEPAMFDDSGASIGCIVPVGNARYLYYMGWHLTVVVPWQNAIGLAVSEGPDQPFRRLSRFPIVELTEVDPYTISYPWVRYEGGRFRMWYGSNLAWGAEQRDMRHVIKYAESDDGIHWERPDIIAIDFADPGEYAICRPCVVDEGGRFRMWFCSRGSSYRIWEAVSTDGVHWTRRTDAPALDVSADGWDSEMVEYPCVFDHAGSRYMLYSGNGYGRTGFGLAVSEGE